MIKHFLYAALFFLLASSPISASGPGKDPKETQAVINYLLSASNEPIPPGSTCFGNYTSSKQPKIRDLISMQLSYFGDGENRIIGKIVESGKFLNCTLTITRSHHEDVSSIQIRFVVKEDKMLIDSLSCIMTP